MREELMEICETGSDEEKEILRLALQAIRQRREHGSAFISGFMGLKGQFLEDGGYRFVIPVTPFMHNPLGVVHGGMLATLLDSTMGSLVNRTLPDHQYSVTTELKIHFLRASKSGTLRSEARILHRGQTLIVLQGSIFDEQGRMLAHGTATFMVLNRKK